MQAELPGDLNGWVTLVTSLAAIAVAWGLSIWRASAYKSGIDTKFEKQGERIGRAESTVATVSAEITDVRRKSQTLEYNVMSLTEGHGEHRARFDALMNRLDTQAERKQAEEKDVAERLARIETQLTIFIRLYSSKGEDDGSLR